MSSYFYFTRHGQTIWNVENKICGATDIALTELGHKQAIELGECIKMENIHIDEILYSPLIRASDTAPQSYLQLCFSWSVHHHLSYLHSEIPVHLHY